MGIFNGNIVNSNPSRVEVVHSLVKEMVDENSEIITIMYGKDVTKEEIDNLLAYIEDEFGIEVDVINGGQEIYSYIISVE